MGPIDRFLNNITMYRVVLYCLLALAGVGLLLAFAGQNIFTFNGWQAVISLVLVVSCAFGSNKFFAWLYKATPNHESAIITGLILFLILPPGSTLVRILSLALGAVIAMASKYILVYRSRHIFNPAAISVVITGIVGLIYPSWWVGSKYMFPFLIISGFLIAKKIRRLQLVIGFLVFTLILLCIKAFAQNSDITELVKLALLSSPLLFFATVMLTEPSTTPYKYRQLIIYAIFVAALSSYHWRVGTIGSSYELSLVLANLIFAYLWFSPSYRLQLKQIKSLGGNSFDFMFKPDKKISFIAGQFGEWTLPNVKVDSRGNRRTFTIASSPESQEVHLAVRIFENSSSYKKSLLNLKIGSHLQLSHIAGEFVLPKDKLKSLVFIAGGIGITPFIAIIQSLMNTGKSRDIVLFYCANHPDELVFLPTLLQTSPSWLLVVPVISNPSNASADWKGRTGNISSDVIKEIPNYKQRQYYISGPPKMVDVYRSSLKNQNISNRQITTDYFSGY